MNSNILWHSFKPCKAQEVLNKNFNAMSHSVGDKMIHAAPSFENTDNSTGKKEKTATERATVVSTAIKGFFI